MKIIEGQQYTEEYWRLHRGVAGASSFGSIITPATGKPSAQAFSLICQLIGDRLSDSYGQMDDYASSAMKMGQIIEPEARRFYEFTRGETVKQVMLCFTDDGRFCCSPDALVGDDGGLEIKSPQAKTHVEYLLSGVLPDIYRAQVHGSLIVTGRKWWDWMSYHNGLPPLLVRVVPNEYTDLLREALDAFWERYQMAWEKVRAMLPEPVAVAANEADELPPMF